MYKVKNVFDNKYRVGRRFRAHNALELASPGLRSPLRLNNFLWHAICHQTTSTKGTSTAENPVDSFTCAV